MQHLRTALFPLGLTWVLLVSGCSTEPPDGQRSTSAAANSDLERVRGEHDRLTEHLTAGVIWAELLEAGAQDDRTTTAQLEYRSGNLSEELGQASMLAAGFEVEPLPGDSEATRGFDQRIRARLEEAKGHLRNLSQEIGEGNRTAVRGSAGSIRAALEAAASEHDSILGVVSDPRAQFRMFALSWPHHELVLNHTGLLGELDRMAADTGTDWAADWRVRQGDLETYLLKSRDALRGFADRLNLPLKTYSLEKGDDAFNAATDAIRQNHSAAAQQIEALEAELRKASPDQKAALEMIGRLRKEIEAARDAHREVARELGEPYPDYDSAFDAR